MKETMYLVTDIFFDTAKGGEREFDAEEASDLMQDTIGFVVEESISSLTSE